MKLLLLFLSLSLAACSSSKPKNTNTSTNSSSKASSEKIPMRDFFRNSVRSSYRLSDDGNQMAFLMPHEKRMNVFVQPSDLSKPPKRLTDIRDRDVHLVGWKGPDHVLFVRDFNGDENFHIFSVNVHNGKQKDLTPFPGTKAKFIDLLSFISESDIIISLNKRNKKLFDVYRLNVDSGELKMIAENPGNITRWMTDHRGRLRIAIATDGVNSTIMHRRTEKSKFSRVITTSFKDTIAPMFFTFDNQNLYVLSNLQRDKLALAEFSLSKKTITRTIYSHREVDLDGVEYSRKRKVLTKASYTTWKSFNRFFDSRTRKLFARIQERFPDLRISLTSHDKNEEKYIVFTSSDREPGTYYFIDTKRDLVRKLGKKKPWLQAEQLAEMKPIKYQSKDGLTINAYLTLPKGKHFKNTRNIPFVVVPHGGPWARDRWGYNAETQFLAHQGYGVLQMNFRGSTGYGKKFWKASFKQWGKKMQRDVTDGVTWLIAKGYADPRRICIYGASYGGYATLSGLVTTPELYACGVDYVGVSNLFTFLKSIPPYWKPYLEMLYEMVGHPEKDYNQLMATSPAKNAHKIRAPLFIAQGAKDPRVVKAESDQMVEALEKKGLKVKYMVKDNEGHGFHNQENRFEFYEEMSEFLKTHLRTKK